MLVSVNISAYNEQDYLPEIFESLKNQTYPLKNIEVVLVNAMSTDNTRALMDQFKAENEHLFYAVKILDNPRKTLNTNGQSLHSKSIEFNHPITGEHLYFETEIPEYMVETMSKLDK